jgi:hypothetical protein
VTTAAVARVSAPLRGLVLSQRLVDVGAIAGAVWLMFGLYLDGWAHNTSLPDSFWTPWHAVFYSGYGVLAAFLALVILRGIASGATFRLAIPEGYAPTVVGVIVFGVGGFLDMIWHTVFGIERSLDVLFSPSHLMLAIGIVLLVSGPLRSVWRRGALSRPTVDAAVAVLSLGMILLMLTFMLQFAMPFAFTPATPGEARLGELAQVRAIFGVLAFTAILVALSLLALREGVLLPGAITFLLILDAVALVAMRANGQAVQREVIYSTALAGGIVGDVLLWRLRPGPHRIVAVRIFAAALPGAIFLWYFVAIAVHIGTWWTVTALLGAPVLAALAGLLISYLVFPRMERVAAR